MKLDCLLPHAEINLKCTINLNIRGKTINLLRKSTGVNHCDLGFCNSFLDKKRKAQATKEKVDKVGYIKTK